MQAPKLTNCGIVTSIGIEISRFGLITVRISFASNHLRCPFSEDNYLSEDTLPVIIIQIAYKLN